MFRSIFAAALMLALVAGPAAAQVRMLSPAAAQALSAEPGVEMDGARQASVTLIEYLDYNCGYCKKMQPEIDRLLKTDTGVRVLYKPWPLFGPVSTYAARVTLAAQWQGKYLAAHKALIGAPSRLDSEATVRRLVSAAGVDLARLDRDLQARRLEIDAMLRRNDEEARRLQLQGTPGLVAGEVLVPGGLPHTALQQLVAHARSGGEAAAR